MQRVLAAIFSLMVSGLLIAAAGDGTMRVSQPAVRDEVHTVIEAQLAAFREGDPAKAYGYASRALRAQTPLPAFALMVQKNYPEIWRSTHAEFAIVRDDGSRAALVVRVFAKDGEASYDYVLLKEAAGWRIGGVLRHASRRADAL